MAASREKSGCLPQFLQIFASHDADEYMEAEIAPYRLRDDFLSTAELSLFYVLKQLIGDQAMLMVKVRLADIFFVSRPHEHAGAFNQISQKHVDFLVCHPQTLKPLFGIELDDSSHNANKRQIRDQFVNEVFNEAQLPLVRIPVQRSYDRAQLSALMSPYLNASASFVAVKDVPELPLQRAIPVCPKCGVNMVIRIAKQGKHIGEQFYACPNYPRCHEMAKA
jgi:uncharacterized protein DUF2726/topoisomerase-like DNA binding C4 zinc finger protein